MVLENKIGSQLLYSFIFSLLYIEDFEKEESIWRSKTKEIKKSSQKFTNYEKWIDEWEKLMQEIIYKRIAL
jgi:hypothetical protein